MKSNEEYLFIKNFNKATKNSIFFKELSKIKYRNLKGYINFDDITFEISRLLYSYQYHTVNFLKQDFIHINTLINLNELYHNGFKPIWLSKDLFTAFNNSELPKKIYQFNRVIKNGILIFPNGVLKSPDNQYINYIVFNHRKKEDVYRAIETLEAKIDIHTIEDEVISWSAYCHNGIQYAVTRGIFVMDNTLIVPEADLHINQTIEYKANIEPELEQEFLNRVFSVLVQTLIYLQSSSKEYKEPVIKVKKDNTENKVSRLVREPYIVGKDYKVKTERTEKVVGSHKSPVTHWRIGHYRNQPYGDRNNPEYKLIWIEPCLING